MIERTELILMKEPFLTLGVKERRMKKRETKQSMKEMR
jgi:hypothetical protein